MKQYKIKVSNIEKKLIVTTFTTIQLTCNYIVSKTHSNESNNINLTKILFIFGSIQ